ncbi:MAG: 50S ribosomal protein L10 [Candidatus Omnitrophota bacterium]|jgi:large subunit ribosomal protein L10
MPKSKLQKGEILRDLTAKIGRSKSIVFATFNALGVKENEELRRKLQAENSEYYVAKKTLMDKAFKDSNLQDFNARELDGKVAAIFSYEDEVAPAKIVDNFRKTREDKIAFVGGILENRFLTAAQVENLAKLPSKLELYSKLVGSINAPVSGFVNVLAGNLRGLVTALKAIADQKA